MRFLTPGRVCTLASVAIFLAATPVITAEPLSVEASTSIASGLIDRGETLARLNNETDLTFIRAFDSADVYASIYRISPIGGDAGAFDEEVDYTIGVAFERSGLAFDASANYLTYPGSSEEPSLERAGEVAVEHTLSPSLAAFYDVDFDVYGLEAAIAPVHEHGQWDLTGIARAGWVSSDEGDYSYAGLEGVAARELSDALTLEAFARVEAADADNFVANVQNDQVTQTRAEGAVIGLRLILQN